MTTFTTLARRSAHRRDPHLTFTSDWHTLLTGRLTVGGRCSISYDPARLMKDVTFGHGAWTVTAFIKAGNVVSEAALASQSGWTEDPDQDSTGQGSMLYGSFTVGATQLALWFSARDPDGCTSWDSDNGCNWPVRSPDVDLDPPQVALTHGSVVDQLTVRVRAPTVEAVTLRLRIANGPHPLNRVNIPMARDAQGGWTASTVVPCGATPVFDLEYYVGGMRWKDNNQGHFYLVG